jgi:hypothetical protein
MSNQLSNGIKLNPIDPIVAMTMHPKSLGTRRQVQLAFDGEEK